MVKNKLMLGAAFAALGLVPLMNTPASAQLLDDYSLNVEAELENELNIELEWVVDVDKYINIYGLIRIDGSVDADALAHATLDDKQSIDRNEVMFEDYQNANMNSSNILDEPGVGQGSGDALFTEEGAASGPALYSNSVDIGAGTLANASGNVGLNVAVGDYNLQENAAVLASAEGAGGVVVDPSTGEITGQSGGAEAGSFSLQSLYDNAFNSDSQSYEDENTDIDNSVSVGAGALDGATGNIGVNAAAGAFNIQKNALVIASVTGGNLAEAAAGVIQHSQWNDSVHENTTNTVNLSASLVGASGNIGVNLAAGVGNMQLNSLTIASALGEAAAVVPPPGPGGPGGPEE
jgi:hypothetical protein